MMILKEIKTIKKSRMEILELKNSMTELKKKKSVESEQG